MESDTLMEVIINNNKNIVSDILVLGLSLSMATTSFLKCQNFHVVKAKKTC